MSQILHRFGSSRWPRLPQLTLFHTACSFPPRKIPPKPLSLSQLHFFSSLPYAHTNMPCVCKRTVWFCSQLYASPVWRSGYSPTSSRRHRTRTGHGSHAQNCLYRSQTSAHLLRCQGVQKVEFQWQRAKSPLGELPHTGAGLQIRCLLWFSEKPLTFSRTAAVLGWRPGSHLC